MKRIVDGIYPTMMVAYNSDGDIDYGAMKALIQWYLENGVHGIFALCHSTESHWLTFSEKLKLAEFTVKTVDGKIPVVMSGVTGVNIDRQIYEAHAISAAGADAIVFIRNRLGGDFRQFCEFLDRIIENVDDRIPLGLYECPYPYNKHLTEAEFAYAVGTGRFAFLKDTSCSMDVMRSRLEIKESAAGSRFSLFNANSATLLESLRCGYNGFSGLMANIHPDLYVWLFEHQNDERAKLVSAYLGMMSLIEMRCYPVCAKRYLDIYEGIHMTDICRSVADTTVPAHTSELEALHRLTVEARSIVNSR